MAGTEKRNKTWLWIVIGIGLAAAGIAAYFVLKRKPKTSKPTKSGPCKTGKWATQKNVCYVKRGGKKSSLSCSVSGAYAFQTRAVSKSCKNKSTTKRVPCPLPECKCEIKSHKQINPEGTCVVDVSGKPVTLSCNFAGNKTFRKSYVAVQPIPKDELKCSSKDLAIQKKPCPLTTSCCTCEKSCKTKCSVPGDSWSKYCNLDNPEFGNPLECAKTCKHNLNTFGSLPSDLKKTCSCPSPTTDSVLKGSCTMCTKKLGPTFLQQDGVCEQCIEKGTKFDPVFCRACKSKFEMNAPNSGLLGITCNTCKMRCTGENCAPPSSC